MYDDYGHMFGGLDHRWRDAEAGWGSDLEESSFSAPHHTEGGFLWLDAHILASPAIADIDGDGVEDLILPVTYFFDHDVYSDPVSQLPAWRGWRWFCGYASCCDLVLSCCLLDVRRGLHSLKHRTLLQSCCLIHALTAGSNSMVSDPTTACQRLVRLPRITVCAI